MCGPVAEGFRRRTLTSHFTDNDAVTEEVVATCEQVVSCEHGIGILSSNVKCEGEGEEYNSFNNVSVEEEHVKMHLQKIACLCTSTEENGATYGGWSKLNIR